MTVDTYLNINYWFISWGYLNGYLKDGQIVTTKFSQIYQWTSIIIMTLNAIKFATLLCNEKGSEISNQLGDWSYFLGPRIMINGIVTICSIYIINAIFLFKFCTRNLKKMFYWLNIMEYDDDIRSFHRMNLNDSDSQLFVKRMSLFILSIKCFSFLFTIGLVFVNFLSVFKYLNDYYINHFVSILLFVPPLHFCIGFAFGLPIILYLVRDKMS